jgi:hypothetical protein
MEFGAQIETFLEAEELALTMIVTVSLPAVEPAPSVTDTYNLYVPTLSAW